MGRNEHHRVNYSKVWKHQKQSRGQSVFIYVQMGNIEQRPQILLTGWLYIVPYPPQQIDERGQKYLE